MLLINRLSTVHVRLSHDGCRGVSSATRCISSFISPTSSSHNINRNSSIQEYEKQMTPKTLALAHTITSTDIHNNNNNNDDDANNNNDANATINQRRALSKAITLIESRSRDHMYQGDMLLNYLIETNIAAQQQQCASSRSHHNVNSNDNDGNNNVTKNIKEKKPFRIGIAGAPGAGKSSFIETFGIYLLDELKNNSNQKNNSGDDNNDDDFNYSLSKLAALCIDPSSTLTGGSILGDKTRMTELSRHPKAFVRPSPSRGDLGGVTSYTNDAVTLCQAAGYDLVMVETVGIGQSEVSVSQVVDMLVLIVAPGGGDGLQGVKKGILEVADLLIVNKADGHLLPVATSTAADYKGAMHFMRSRVEGWEAPPVLLASAITKDGFSKVWEEICKYRRIMTDNGELDRRKGKQARYWMWNHVQDLISLRIKSDSRIGAMANDVETALDQGTVSPRVAASDLLQCLNLTFHSKND